MQFRVILLFLCACQFTFGALKFVQIWFRHGERLPTHFLKFPSEDSTDLKYLDIAYPGELTNNGIYQEMILGEKLRAIYGSHFGKKYIPTDFHVYTGKDNRTSTSAQAMFSGFFPPTKEQRWNDKLNWQPIAQETDVSLDWVSLGAVDNCPVYGETFRDSSEYIDVLSQVEEQDPGLIELVRKHSGIPIKEATKYNHAIDSLKIRTILQDPRFPVPEWAHGYEDRILNMSFSIHDKIVKIQNESIGNYHVELIMTYFENHLKSNKTKGIFISGHDTNIVTIWDVLQLKNHPNDIPYFGAHLAIEMHEKAGALSLKFFLSMGFNETQVEVTPALCEDTGCSWEKFKSLTESSRKSKSDWILECQGIERAGEPVSTITGSMIVLLSILVLSTIILGFTTFSYKRQLNSLRDPERARLL
uniref:Acid phosphatase n=1 Tax=Caenorhabditis japonica TaxID=281687 RepID=A0A8R1HSK2_CAEJA